MRELIAKYPKTTFMIFSKLYWIVSFFYSVYVIQGHIPSMKQFILGSIFVLLTLPISYWLTYNFGEKK